MSHISSNDQFVTRVAEPMAGRRCSYKPQSLLEVLAFLTDRIDALAPFGPATFDEGRQKTGEGLRTAGVARRGADISGEAAGLLDAAEGCIQEAVSARNESSVVGEDLRALAHAASKDVVAIAAGADTLDLNTELSALANLGPTDSDARVERSTACIRLGAAILQRRSRL